MADADSRFRVPAELVTGALVAAATLPLARLFSGGGIGGTIIGSLVASAAVAWGLRRLRVPAIPAAVASAAAFAWYASAVWARSDMWGPFPSPGSIEALLDVMSTGARSAQIEVAPTFATAGLKVLVASVVWGLAWLADDAVSKLRHPLLAVAFCLPVVVFPGTLLPSSRWWFDAALFIVAAMAVLFVDERGRLARWGALAGSGRPGWRPGLAARMGAVVIAAAIGLSPLVQTRASAEGGPGGGGGPGAGVALNPLVSIQPRLNETPETHLFTVRSTVGSYWRLTALDSFDGTLWSARPTTSSQPISGRTVPADVTTTDTVRAVQEFELRALAGRWLPAAYDPVRVDGRDRVRLAGASRTLYVPGPLRGGGRVRVTSLVPAPKAAALDAAPGVDSPALLPYRTLPDGLPAAIRQRAFEITADAPTPFRKALALQDYFRAFEYDQNVAIGHSIRGILDFLDIRRGYCEQFAGTMAVLARAVGLPSRVAIGFAVGEPIDRSTYRVTTRNAHAWVEIYLAGHGWLAFEPTPRPDGGVAQPAYAQPGALAPAASPTNPAAEPTASPTTDPTLDPRLADEGDVPNFVPGESTPGRNPAPIVLAALTLSLVVVMPGAAAYRRARRRRRARTPSEHVRVTYVDFLEWCAAARLPRRPGETPAEYARRLAEISSPAERPARHLAALVTEALWSPSSAADPTEAQRAGAEARRAIAASLPRHVRLLPATGWGWWRGDGQRDRFSAARDAGRG